MLVVRCSGQAGTGRKQQPIDDNTNQGAVAADRHSPMPMTPPSEMHRLHLGLVTTLLGIPRMLRAGYFELACRMPCRPRWMLVNVVVRTRGGEHACGRAQSVQDKPLRHSGPECDVCFAYRVCFSSTKLPAHRSLKPYKACWFQICPLREVQTPGAKASRKSAAGSEPSGPAVLATLLATALGIWHFANLVHSQFKTPVSLKFDLGGDVRPARFFFLSTVSVSCTCLLCSPPQRTESA